MPCRLHLQLACDDRRGLPAATDFQRWIETALQRCRVAQGELCLRLVDEDEITDLNRRYRSRDEPTDVLSFAAEKLPQFEQHSLGDVVICAPIVRRQAGRQGRSVSAHWAHLAVHGTLHLLGFDHVLPPQAARMEALENDILVVLGYPAPHALDCAV